MAVQQYELSIVFKAALLTTESKYPVTSPAVSTTSTQPWPPIILESNQSVFVQMCVFSEKEQLEGESAFVWEKANKTQDED